MNLRKQFPIFQNNPELIYLDNAATTQKPRRVINAIVEYYENYNANVHRGLYPLSEKSTKMYESARINIAKFINADPKEIIFTSGTTDGLNSIAQSLKLSNLISNEPKILLTEIEHHSNVIPWQRLSKNLYYIPVKTIPEKVTDFIRQKTYLNNSNLFGISEDEHHPVIEAPYDILSFTLVSNVTGSIADAKKIVKASRKHNKKKHFIIIDAAQAISHIPINVKELDADFIVFSGHKMYGPTGIGVIWAKKELLEKLQPFRVGGGMITSVTRQGAEWEGLPEKFEAGTPPIAQVIGLSEAVNFIKEISFTEIQNHEQILRKYLIEELEKIHEINIYHPALTQIAAGVVSFTVNNIHPHDIAQFLGERDICVRAGHHCTQILHREVLEVPASVRISLSVYNTKEDIDKLILGLKDVINLYTK